MITPAMCDEKAEGRRTDALRTENKLLQTEICRILRTKKIITAFVFNYCDTCFVHVNSYTLCYRNESDRKSWYPFDCATGVLLSPFNHKQER